MSPTNNTAAQQLQHCIQSNPWFHAIDFGDGLQSAGRFQNKAPNYTLMASLQYLSGFDLTGAFVVDVGTMDGLAAFTAKALGAKRVLATDMECRENFEAGRDYLGYSSEEIEYQVPLPVMDLPKAVDSEKADLVVMAGVLYHVFDPLAVLVACRQSIKRNGYLLVETMFLFDEPNSRVSFNPADTTARAVDHANTFWRPSKSALLGMLEVAGFEVVGSCVTDGRITALAQAKRPSEIHSSSPLIQKIHKSYMRYGNYRERIDYVEMNTAKVEESTIAYTGRRGDWRIVPALHRPQTPLHPQWSPRSESLRVRAVAKSVGFAARSVAATLLRKR